MLTFAHFERELASERVKDKFLEQAKKGMWKGGVVPFGNRRENKKLVRDGKQADAVLRMYETYIESGSIAAVCRDMQLNNFLNRSQRSEEPGSS